MPRKGYKQTEKHREAISTGKLIAWLEAVYETGLTPTGKEPSPAQLNSCKLLLDRTMPVLSAVEQHVETTENFVIHSPAQFDSAQEWEKAVEEAKEKAGAKAPTDLH